MAASLVPICQDDIAHSTAAPAAAVLGDGSGQVGVENSDRHMAAGAEVNPQTDRPRRDAGSADQRVHKGDSISEASCACDHSPHAAQDERASNARPGAAGQQPACHVPGPVLRQSQRSEGSAKDAPASAGGSIELSFRRGLAHDLYPGLLLQHGPPDLVVAPNAGQQPLGRNRAPWDAQQPWL